MPLPPPPASSPSVSIDAVFEAAGLASPDLDSFGSRKGWDQLGARRKGDALKSVYHLLRSILSRLDSSSSSSSSPSSALVEFLRRPEIQSVLEKDSAHHLFHQQLSTQFLAQSSVVQALVDNYRSSTKNAWHVGIISVLTQSFTLKQVQTFLPEVGQRLWRDARRFADLNLKDALLKAAASAAVLRHRSTISSAKMKSVVAFCFHPDNCHDVASAVRTLLLDGMKVELAKMVRISSFDALVRKYQQQHPKGSPLFVGRSTLYLLFRIFASKALQAESDLDNYLVDGLCVFCFLLAFLLILFVLLLSATSISVFA